MLEKVLSGGQFIKGHKKKSVARYGRVLRDYVILLKGVEVINGSLKVERSLGRGNQDELLEYGFVVDTVHRMEN